MMMSPGMNLSGMNLGMSSTSMMSMMGPSMPPMPPTMPPTPSPKESYLNSLRADVMDNGMIDGSIFNLPPSPPPSPYGTMMGGSMYPPQPTPYSVMGYPGSGVNPISVPNPPGTTPMLGSSNSMLLVPDMNTIMNGGFQAAANAGTAGTSGMPPGYMPGYPMPTPTPSPTPSAYPFPPPPPGPGPGPGPGPSPSPTPTPGGPPQQMMQSLLGVIQSILSLMMQVLQR